MNVNLWSTNDSSASWTPGVDQRCLQSTKPVCAKITNYSYSSPNDLFHDSSVMVTNTWTTL